MKKAMLFFWLMILIINTIIPIYAIDDTDVHIKYNVHIQAIGWEKDFSRKDGEIAGTTGQCLRMEAIKIKLENAPLNVKLKYQAHIQGIGWQDWVKDGQVAGTTGQCLRLEAIKIELIGTDKYTVRYKVHVQGIGWQDWVEDGQVAGTTGRCLRAEAIQIEIVKKDKNKENKTNESTLYATKRGIDVSKYQGNIDWAKVKQDGISFAMIRAGYRGYGTTGTLVTDAKFHTNMKGAIGNGLDVGVYFFSQAINELEAIQEANCVLNLVKDYNITYPIAIDTEDIDYADGRADNLSKLQRTNVIKTFCKRIKQAGYQPMVYSNKWWLEEQLDMSQLSDYPVWLAHYTGATQDNPLAKPSDYNGNYIMWQYTDKAVVNGITGNVDADIIMIR